MFPFPLSHFMVVVVVCNSMHRQNGEEEEESAEGEEGEEEEDEDEEPGDLTIEEIKEEEYASDLTSQQRAIERQQRHQDEFMKAVTDQVRQIASASASASATVSSVSHSVVSSAASSTTASPMKPKRQVVQRISSSHALLIFCFVVHCLPQAGRGSGPIISQPVASAACSRFRHFFAKIKFSSSRCCHYRSRICCCWCPPSIIPHPCCCHGCFFLGRPILFRSCCFLCFSCRSI